MERKGVKLPDDLKLPSDSEMKELGIDVEEEKTPLSIPSITELDEEDDWVEIPYKDGVIMKVRRDKLKKLLE